MSAEETATETADAAKSEAPKEAAASVDKQKPFKHGPKDFELGNILGDGAFGKVVIGTVVNADSPYHKKKFAVKIMDKRHIVKNKKEKYVTIEKNVFLKTNKHPFMCHMHFSYQDPYSLYMVLDLCSDENLAFLIYKYICLSEDITRIYVSELVSCLDFMHSDGIYHRDIKPENILIGFDGHIRLTDFGTAKMIDKDDEKQVQAAKEKQEKGVQSDNEEEDNNNNNNNNHNNDNDNNNSNSTNNNENNNDNEQKNEKNNGRLKPSENRDRKQSFVGTAQYVPPEMLSNKPYSFAGMDFWALGCLIYQCLVGKPPFQASNEYLTFKKIEAMEYDLPDSLSDNATNIIQSFLNADLENRLGMKGFDSIKEHKFFSDKNTPWDWDEMLKVEIPLRPPTPDASPVKLDPNRHGRSSSAWNELDDLKNAKVSNVAISTDSLAPDSGTKNTGSFSNEGPNSISRMNTSQNNDNLYERWKKFLINDEKIEFGSAVSQSKMFGFSNDPSVMVLTNQQRILFIDGQQMKLKKDISLNTVKSCAAADKEILTIRFAKKTMKLKTKGATAQRWKIAIDSALEAANKK